MKKGRGKTGGLRNIRLIAEEIAGGLGISVKDVEAVTEGGAHILRVILDKPGGVTIKDCEVVSKALSPRLDDEMIFFSQYFLEVSSPGVRIEEEDNSEA